MISCCGSMILYYVIRSINYYLTRILSCVQVLRVTLIICVKSLKNNNKNYRSCLENNIYSYYVLYCVKLLHVLSVFAYDSKTHMTYYVILYSNDNETTKDHTYMTIP